MSLFLLFSAPFHRIGGNATLRPLIWKGGGVWGRSCRLWRRCMLDGTLMIHLGLWNRPRVVLRPAASILRHEGYLPPHLQWAMGSEGHPFNCLPLPKKINSLLELHRHQRRNGTALKWRQNTFTFVRYDYRCPLVSLLLLWRNFSGWIPLSLAGPVLFLLLIWTSCSLSLDSSLPGCWIYFCALPQAIHSAYMKHLLLTDTVKYYIHQEGFFPQRFTM